MKICATCGASVADDAEVCPDCGMELNAGSSLPAPSPAAAGFPTAPPVAPPPAADAFAMDFGGGEINPSVFDNPAPASGPSGTIALEPAAAAPPPAPISSVPTARLILKRGGLPTADVFTFGGTAIVGRFDADSGPVDVDLGPLPEASYVSRHHAELRPDAGIWKIRDLGSRNGTFWRAGGQGAFARVTGEQELASGDEVALGNARFEFQIL